MKGKNVIIFLKLASATITLITTNYWIKLIVFVSLPRGVRKSTTQIEPAKVYPLPQTAILHAKLGPCHDPWRGCQGSSLKADSREVAGRQVPVIAEWLTGIVSLTGNMTVGQEQDVRKSSQGGVSYWLVIGKARRGAEPVKVKIGAEY